MVSLFRFKTVLGRLRFLFFIAALIISITTLMFLFALRDKLKNGEFVRYTEKMEIVSTTFENLIIKNYVDILITFAKDIEQDMAIYKEALFQLSEADQQIPAKFQGIADRTLMSKINVLSSNQNISLVYIALAGWKKYLSSADLSAMDPNYAAQGRGWYKNVVNNTNYFNQNGTNIFISSPYVSALRKKTVITISVAINDKQNKLMAVVSIDFFVTSLFSSIKPDPNVVTYFGLEDGTLFMSTDDPNIPPGTKTTDKDKNITPDMLKGDLHFVKDGTLYLAYKMNVLRTFNIQNSSYIDWEFVIADRSFHNKFIRNFISYMSSLMSVLVIVIILFVAIILILKRRTLTPLVSIKDKIQDLSNGIIDTSRLNTNSQDEIFALNNGINKLEDTISDFTEQVQDGVQILNSSSSGLNNVSNSLSKTSEELHEIATMINSASSSIKTDFFANRGDVESILKVMADYSSKIENSIKLLANTSASINDILNRVKIINEISYNTNLIALNASIEASKAGEAGRGFAVVAIEIRKLSERSKDASSSINSRIREIITFSEETSLLLKNLSTEFKTMQNDMNKVVEAYKNNEEVIVEIEKNSNNLKEISDISSADSKEILDLSGDLLETSASLSEISKKFTIKETK